jgi:hypothetical protein
MRALSNSELLRVWEQGCGMHPLDQGLLALEAALPELSRATLAEWPLGRRNVALAELRSCCFGRNLRGWISCPACKERLEFELDGTLLAGETGAGTQTESTITVRDGTFRLLNSRDLASIAGESDPQRAMALLLDRCCLARQDDSAWAAADLEDIGEQLAQADPMAEARVGLRCSSCDYEWEETIDPATFVWADIEARARRVLIDVATLASAYGWSEEHILALSDVRRAAYLEMVRV